MLMMTKKKKKKDDNSDYDTNQKLGRVRMYHNPQ